VYIEVKDDMRTLLDFKYRNIFRARAREARHLEASTAASSGEDT
jgi:GTPase involved in cell partitioning and DNA repair